MCINVTSNNCLFQFFCCSHLLHILLYRQHFCFQSLATIAFTLTHRKRVCIRAKWPIRPELIPVSVGMKRLGEFLLPSGWDASPSQGYPRALNSLVTICIPGRREELTVRVKCLTPKTQHTVPCQG